MGEHLPGLPTTVNITIPTELIDIARTYPALDWNDLMRYAVEARRDALAKHRPCVDCGNPTTLLSDDDKLRCFVCNDRVSGRSGGGE